MSRPVQILLLDTNDAMGGVVRVHLNLLRAYDRNRVDATLACFDRGALKPMFQAVPRIRIWQMNFGTKPIQDCFGWRARVANACSLVPFGITLLRLAWACRRHGIEVIHTSDKRRSVMLVNLLRRLTRARVIYHIHSEFVDYPANRALLGAADAVVANSEAMRVDFEQALKSAVRPIEVVYNGLDETVLRPDLPSTLRAEIAAAPDDVLVGIVSRLAPDKGQETFVRAAALVAAVCPQARFVIVGDDKIASDNADFAAFLKGLVRELGLQARTHFLGYRADMANVYAGLDIVVDAAWCEAFGMVVVEPMACAKAVVGSAAGGIPEIIEDGVNGLLFALRDVQALASALQRLVSDAGLRRRLGLAARRTVEARFTIRVQASAIETICERLAGRA